MNDRSCKQCLFCDQCERDSPCSNFVAAYDTEEDDLRQESEDRAAYWNAWFEYTSEDVSPRIYFRP